MVKDNPEVSAESIRALADAMRKEELRRELKKEKRRINSSRGETPKP